MKAKTILHFRQLSHIAFFALFMILFVQAVYLGESPLPSDFFYRFDPLIAATAMLAGRTLIAGLLYSLVTIALSILFGRVWCGWICPFGSVLEWFSPKISRGNVPNKLRTVKFLAFFTLIFAALLGNQSAAFLDPISILTRSMTTAIWPGLRLLVIGLEGFLYRFDALWPVLDLINQDVLLPIFQGIESVFIAALPIFLFFVIVLGLNHLAERFWCRYLCPLGGFLGLTSRLAVFRREVNADCIACGKCVTACPTGTVNADKNFESDPAECTMCFDCADICTVNAIHFPAHLPKWEPAEGQAYDPLRRQVLLTAVGALGGVALAGIEPIQRRQPDRLIRPPGATLTDFTTMCMRCGECVRVCPTQGLQPNLLEGGWQNIFTPRLVPRLGYCSYNCDACIRTCPTGAIPSISREEKQITPIGLASINTDRCLPWAYDTLCSVCEEMCPLPDKAITLEEVDVPTNDGGMMTIFRPKVNRELCIGCGLCEYHCPVGGEAAIQVQSLPDATGFIPGI
ncbi:MAG TPA: 4Fe-4S dicluster domain-containing protein [Pelolinea sp.]|nr:4Fe-4S dicluster domain-containing protein [Pelolinea sp.]